MNWWDFALGVAVGIAGTLFVLAIVGAWFAIEISDDANPRRHKWLWWKG
jgi:hypothetical protein